MFYKINIRARYPARLDIWLPDIRPDTGYPAFEIAGYPVSGYPANLLSGASLDIIFLSYRLKKFWFIFYTYLLGTVYERKKDILSLSMLGQIFHKLS